MYIKVNHAAPKGNDNTCLVFGTAIVGLRYRQEQVNAANKRSRFRDIQFAAEPNNPADRNAIAAFAGGVHIGYLLADIAEQIKLEGIDPENLYFQVQEIRREDGDVTGVYGNLWHIPPQTAANTRVPGCLSALLISSILVAVIARSVAAIVFCTLMLCVVSAFVAVKLPRRRSHQSAPRSERDELHDLKKRINSKVKIRRAARQLTPEQAQQRRAAMIITAGTIAAVSILTAVIIGGFVLWFCAVIISIAAMAAGLVIYFEE